MKIEIRYARILKSGYNQSARDTNAYFLFCYFNRSSESRRAQHAHTINKNRAHFFHLHTEKQSSNAFKLDLFPFIFLLFLAHAFFVLPNVNIRTTTILGIVNSREKKELFTEMMHRPNRTLRMGASLSNCALICSVAVSLNLFFSRSSCFYFYLHLHSISHTMR